MLTKEWKQFESGTDIRGAVSEGPEPINLTDEVVECIARSFALWFLGKARKASSGLSVALGHDSRILAPRTSAAVTRVPTGCGICVFDCGLASTPSMFMAALDIPCDSVIQITTNRHPFNRNRLKFSVKTGELDAPDIEVLLLYVQENKAPAIDELGSAGLSDHMKTYNVHLRNIVKQGVNAENHD